MRRFFSIIAIFALMSTSFAVNPLKIFVAKSKTVKGDYVDVESLKVNHAYIETLDAHSPIHVVAPLYLYYGAKDSASYISWFVTHHEDTIATVWGDTIGADTTDSVCIGDSVNGFVYFYGCPDKAVSRDDFGVFDNFGNFTVDTTTDSFSNFPCACVDAQGVLSYQNKNNENIAAAAGDTVFLYYWDSKSSAVTDSFILVAKEYAGKYYWYLYGCKKKWIQISNTRCINISDTLFQIFGNDTFYLREKRNY